MISWPDREYLQNATKYRQSEKVIQTTDTPTQANLIRCSYYTVYNNKHQPVQRFLTSPASTVQSWRPRSYLSHQNECRCICQNGSSCHFWRSSHCRMLQTTICLYTGRDRSVHHHFIINTTNTIYCCCCYYYYYYYYFYWILPVLDNDQRLIHSQGGHRFGGNKIKDFSRTFKTFTTFFPNLFHHSFQHTTQLLGHQVSK